MKKLLMLAALASGTLLFGSGETAHAQVLQGSPGFVRAPVNQRVAVRQARRMARWNYRHSRVFRG